MLISLVLLFSALQGAPPQNKPVQAIVERVEEKRTTKQPDQQVQQAPAVDTSRSTPTSQKEKEPGKEPAEQIYKVAVQSQPQIPTDKWFEASVIISGILTCAAIATLIAIFRQTDKLADQVAQMIDAGRQTDRNFQAMINVERPWIEIELILPRNDEEEWDRMGPEGPPYDPHIIKVTNHGKTVARIVSYRIWYDSFPGKVDMDGFKHSREISRHLLLGTGRSETLHHIEVAEWFDKVVWKAITEDTVNGVMRIDVRYQDIIGGGPEPQTPHETQAVFRYSPQSQELHRLLTYNVYK